MYTRVARICFLVGGREGGGSAFSTLQLIQGIDRTRYDVRVVACEDGPYTERIRAAGQECDSLNTGWPPMMRRPEGAETRHTVGGYLRFPAWLLKTAAALRGYIRANRIDIVHTNYHHFHFVAGLTCVISRCRCVWHWRAPVGGTRAAPGRRDFRWMLVRVIGGALRSLVGESAWSIANSAVTADDLRSLVGDRLSVVYNGVSMAPLPSDRVRLLQLLDLPTGVRVVGLVGSLNPLKGHRYFIEAAARICQRHDDVHFVYIGGQTAAKQKDYQDILLTRRRELGLETRVHFLGHRADAAQLVADFDVATVCTLPPGEGFGLVIVEAMAQGVPVISTDEGAAREIVSDGRTGVLIPAADAGALADAIESLLSDEKRRRAIGMAGYELCKEKYDIRRTIREVQAVYERVL